MKEAIDEKDEFHIMLNTLKAFVPAAVFSRYKYPTKSPALMSLDLKFPIHPKDFDQLSPITDIFEWMFLNAVEQSEFDNLDPEIQKLYLKAQKIINEEQKDES